MAGLGVNSFRCFIKNLASGSSPAQGQVLLDHASSIVTFTPQSFLVKESEEVIDSLPDRGYIILNDFIAQFPELFSSAEEAASKVSGRYGKDAIVVGNAVLYSRYWTEPAQTQAEILSKEGFLQPQVCTNDLLQLSQHCNSNHWPATAPLGPSYRCLGDFVQGTSEE